MELASVLVRPMAPADLADVARIQAQSEGQAAQWDPSDYLRYEAWIAEFDGVAAGFLVLQAIPPDQAEILNLAVDLAFRRRGIGRSLVERCAGGRELFLEVRESNADALQFYARLGFREIGRRNQYYTDSPEAAIVMSLQKC